jgi:catechol 2,3-dioxygenase-like lactoylglutathione lyase family enzyme
MQRANQHGHQEASMGEQVVMSLGVEDLERAKHFYTDGLGFEEDQDHGFFVSFKHDDRGPTLGLYTSDPLKYDASLVTEAGGHHGVTLSRIVETAERVDELMAQAAAAGARILEPAHTAAWGGYIGYFTDPDGNLWKVVVGQSE